MHKVTDSPIHVGDIVRLNAAVEAFGEKHPHMVVIEVVKEKIEGINRFKCHCVWFIREKVWEFKYAWLTNTTLSAIKPFDAANILKSELKNILFLSNTSLELTKVEDKNGNINLDPTNHCSPALTVIGLENPKNQAPTFDSNSNVIREVSSLLAKCLYFNPISNKYSEILLPVEALCSKVKLMSLLFPQPPPIPHSKTPTSEK